MSEQVTVDSLDFARSGKTLSGEFAVAALDRLHDRLASPEGKIEYELSGITDSKGKLGLHCRVRGTLNLICQRCLQAMAWPIKLDSDLVLVSSEAELGEGEDDPEAPDVLLAQKELNVQELVEDELLLGMPMAPRHPEGQCGPTDIKDSKEAVSPFAALAKLKPSKH